MTIGCLHSEELEIKLFRVTAVDEISGLTTTSDFRPVHRLLGATPEQRIETAQSRARSFGMENQQLLAQGEVLADEVLLERKTENPRADIDGAQTSRNASEMRAMMAGSEVIDSANVLSCGGTQLRFRPGTSYVEFTLLTTRRITWAFAAVALAIEDQVAAFY